MKKIRVLICVDSIQYGGVEQVVYNYVSKMDTNKYDFTITTTGIRYPKAEEKFKKIGVKIFGLPLKKHNIIRYLLSLKKIVKYGHFDVVHSNTNYWSWIVLRYAKINNVRIRIAHVHGVFNKSIKCMLFSKLTVHYSTINLACGNLAGKSVYNKSSYQILTNGINTNLFKYDEKTRLKIREKYGINKNTKIIGHVGRFYSVKNHIFIIDLFYNYHIINSNSKLWLIGSGDLLEEIKVKVKLLNIEKYVTFFGDVDEIYKMYQAFDIFILPSLNEGFGVSVLEAQCSGLNCIVSDKVPKDVGITNNVIYLPLNEKQRWINCLCKNFNINDRFNEYKILNKLGFNINENIIKLENIYNGKS